MSSRPRRAGSRCSTAGPDWSRARRRRSSSASTAAAPAAAAPSGTGLGLPIARELAGQWGGEVTLAPREGGGTVAGVSLPTDFAGPLPEGS